MLNTCQLYKYATTVRKELHLYSSDQTCYVNRLNDNDDTCHVTINDQREYYEDGKDDNATILEYKDCLPIAESNRYVS